MGYTARQPTLFTQYGAEALGEWGNGSMLWSLAGYHAFGFAEAVLNSFQVTGNVSLGSNVIASVSSTANVYDGGQWLQTTTNLFPAKTLIVSHAANSITVNANATGTLVGETLNISAVEVPNAPLNPGEDYDKQTFLKFCPEFATNPLQPALQWVKTGSSFWAKDATSPDVPERQYFNIVDIDGDGYDDLLTEPVNPGQAGDFKRAAVRFTRKISQLETADGTHGPSALPVHNIQQ